MKKNKVDKGRRRFLKFGVMGSAGLVMAVYFGTGGEKTKKAFEIWNKDSSILAPNAWISIDSTGIVTVRVNHSELGQGITTALPMIIAEELEADWSRIRFEIAPAEAVYKNPAFNSQLTAASTSVKTSWDILRKAGAAVREMLIAAAASTWNVNVSECRAEKGAVIHTTSGQRLEFGKLAGRASRLPVPKKVVLKNPDEFKIIGQPLKRLDSSSKFNGSAVFGIDVKLPGLLTATVIHPPVFNARVKLFDSDTIKNMKGIRHVLEIDNGIAVVADSFWQAKNGADTLKIEWTHNEIKDLDSEKLLKRWGELSNKEGKTIHEQGNPKEALANSSKEIKAVYELPYQAHATAEPMNCTAYIHKGICDVWAPTQNQDAAQEMAARITGLKYENINIHTPFVGGGFGRRIAVDYVAEAVQIAKMIKAPVKVIWTREEDMTNDFYRPANTNVIKAGLNEQGFPVTWSHRIVGPDHMAHMLPRLLPSFLPYWIPRSLRDLVSGIANRVLPGVIPGKKISEGASHIPYAIENINVDYVEDDPGIPLGFWRSVAFSHNTFVVESFIDEIAAAAEKDPFKLRLKLLEGKPRMQNVLKLAAEKTGWTNENTNGLSRGIAFLDFHGTILCFIAEVTVSPKGHVKVQRVICAVDCGIVINPQIVKSQISGGIVFGLTATLKSSITVRKGRIVESNFDDFPLLRIDEMPVVDVHMVKSAQPPTGIGESAVPLIAPAVTNAVFAATGKRIRRIPIDNQTLIMR